MVHVDRFGFAKRFTRFTIHDIRDIRDCSLLNLNNKLNSCMARAFVILDSGIPAGS